MLEISGLAGLWWRSLIVLPDGSRDTDTEVRWLQGPGLYADLRRPPGRPDFAGVRRLRDLAPRHLAWMARQEGFAGRLVRDGDVFEWRRAVDFQPPSGFADAGRLWFEDGILKEAGRDVAYLEHWHRRAVPDSRGAGVMLRDAANGTAGVLVAVGGRFMLARDRPAPLPPGPPLPERIAAAATRAAGQDLVDCEIAIGDVDGDRWTITASTLPFREGEDLAPRREHGRLTHADRTADGEPFRRAWAIVEAEGTPGIP